MVSVSVSVDPKPFYGPGDVVKGFVTVNTSKPKADCTVKAVLRGAAQSTMTEHCLHKCGDSDVTHYRKQDFYTHNKVLVSSVTIPAGTTQYPFEFTIPAKDDIPSTIKPVNMGILFFQQAEVSLLHSVEGQYVGDAGFFDNTSSSAEFTFYGTIQDSSPVSNSINDMVTTFGLSTKGTVGLDLSLPTDLVAMGQELKFSLRTDNSGCELDIKGLRVRIKKQLIGKSNYENITKDSEVGKTTFEFSVPSGKSMNFDGAVAIPHLEHATTATETVDCDYYLQLTPVYSAFCVQAPSVMVKVKIQKTPI